MRHIRSVVFIALLLFSCGCANQFLLHPSTAVIHPKNAERRTIEIAGRDIEIWVSKSPGAEQSGEPKAFVLEFTGNASRAEWIVNYVAGRWGDRPVEVWAMNYPGFGGSAGPATLDAIAPAALAVYDDLANHAEGKPIFVSGFSLGTAPALYVASKRSVAGIMLHNPPALQTAIMRRHGWWNLGIIAGSVAMQVPKELNSLETAPQANARAVFVLSGSDRTVPPEYQEMVLSAYGGEKHVIRMPEAGHNTPIFGEAEEQLQKELDWLWERVE